MAARNGMLALVMVWTASACTYTYHPSAEHCGNFTYGDQTHILFDFRGSDSAATEIWEAADCGVSDDIRVQRIVDALVVELEARSFEPDEYDRDHGYLWLRALDEPRSAWGPLSEAMKVPDPRGEEKFLYQWTDSAGGRIEISESAYREHHAVNTVNVTFGRAGGPHGGDCIRLSVSSPQRGPKARPAVDHRNAGSMIYGVMGIVVRRDEAELPPGFALSTTITISASTRTDAQLLDEIVVAAFNRALASDEVVQLYRHATLEEPGDSDERVTSYLNGVERAVLIKRPEQE